MHKLSFARTFISIYKKVTNAVWRDIDQDKIIAFWSKMFNNACYTQDAYDLEKLINKDKLSICCNFFEIYIPLARLYIYIFI